MQNKVMSRRGGKKEEEFSDDSKHFSFFQQQQKQNKIAPRGAGGGPSIFSLTPNLSFCDLKPHVYLTLFLHSKVSIIRIIRYTYLWWTKGILYLSHYLVEAVVVLSVSLIITAQMIFLFLLVPPLMRAKYFWRTCLQSCLHTSPPTQYPKFGTLRPLLKIPPFVCPNVA